MFDYVCNDTLKPLQYTRLGHTVTCEVDPPVEGNAFRETCRDFVFDTCNTSVLTNYEIIYASIEPFITTPHILCKYVKNKLIIEFTNVTMNCLDGYEQISGIPYSSGNTSFFTFREAVLAFQNGTAIDTNNINHWKLAPPSIHDILLAENTPNISLGFPFLNTTRNFTQDYRMFLQWQACFYPSSGTPAEIITGCQANDELTEGLQCEEWTQYRGIIGTGTNNTLNEALRGGRFGVDDLSPANLDQAKNNLPCAESGSANTVLVDASNPIVEQFFEIENEKVTYVQGLELEIDADTLANQVLVLKRENGIAYVLGTGASQISFSLNETDWQQLLTNPSGNFTTNHKNCIFRKHNIDLGAAQTMLTGTWYGTKSLEEAWNNCNAHNFSQCVFSTPDVISACAGFLSRFDTIECAEAAARDTRSWETHDALQALRPEECVAPEKPETTHGGGDIDWDTWCRAGEPFHGVCSLPKCSCAGWNAGDVCELTCPFPGYDNSVCGSKMSPPMGACVENPEEDNGIGMCKCTVGGDPLKGCRTECTADRCKPEQYYTNENHSSQYRYCGLQERCTCLPPHVGWYELEMQVDTGEIIPTTAYQVLQDYTPDGLTPKQLYYLRMYQNITSWVEHLHSPTDTPSLNRLRFNPSLFQCHGERDVHPCTKNDLMQAELIESY
ncbi:hypothetical protein OAU26_03815, partial [Mariniblastus sp.]|nr:hypothetical protein [Mariniblastus sp.]